MGLNLTALAALAKKEEPSAQSSQANSTSTSTKELHNAPSQSPNVPSATSVLQSLASLGAKASATKEETQAKQVDQPGRVPAGREANDPKQIKYQEISDKIVELRDAIHGAHPKMPGLLQEIWSTVRSYSEQVTLLEEDQMEIIIAGLEKVVDTDLAQITLKSATSSKGKKAAVSNASLGF